MLSIVERSLAGAVCFLLVFLAPPAAAEPAQLTMAERTAVEALASYLDGGAEALWSRVATGSELHQLGTEAARQELSVRLGPSAGAQWRLVRLASGSTSRAALYVEFPSGIDDLLVFETDSSGRGLTSVRSLADPVGEPLHRMAGLSNLRHLLSRGDVGLSDSGEVDTLLESASGSGSDWQAYENLVRKLWLSQYKMLRADMMGAFDALDPETEASAAPLDRLLRARVAAGDGDMVTARKHFRQLFQSGLESDQLRLELFQGWLNSDDLNESLQELSALAATKSRMAEVYYAQSQFGIFGDLRIAASAFRTAWAQQPIERGELLEDPYFAYLLRNSDLADLLELSQADEPVVGPGPTRQPLAWPDRAKLTVVGKFLLAEVGRAVIEVPGGGLWAPASVPASQAAVLRRRQDERMLAEVGRLDARLRSARALESPALLRAAENAAEALSRAMDESDSNARGGYRRQLLSLTDPIQRSQRPPASLSTLRANALWQEGRKQDAIDLLARFVASSEDVAQDPSVLFQLARLCADEDRPDLAARLLRRLPYAEKLPGVRRQIARYVLDNDLAAKYETHETGHFLLRHDKALDRNQVVVLGGYLEAELQRLREWIPFEESLLSGSRRIHVHLVPARDFYDVYGGGVGVLGLFDGRIRLPVFEVGKESAVMTGVLSHELAHAMIDAVTNDCAPKWFHEGLAQLMEPGAAQSNPYRAGVPPIAMPLLESILRGFSESKLVEQAYQEAYWTLRFIEREHGKEGIHGLLGAFAGCRKTPDALHSALQRSPQDLDRRLQAWAKGPSAPMEDRTPRLAFTDAQMEQVEANAPGFSEAIEQQAGSRRTLPKVGVREEKLLTQEQIEDKLVDAVQSLMEEWYEEYARRALPVKTDLALALRTIREQVQLDAKRDVRKICDDVSAQILVMQAVGVFESVDKDVSDSLRQAYSALAQATAACVGGKAMDPYLKRADQHLKQAAYHLDKYGLKP